MKSKRLEVPSEECAACLLVNNSPEVNARGRRLHRKRGCPTEGCRNHSTWLKRKRRSKGIVGS